MIDRYVAIEKVLGHVEADDLVLSTTGMISREVFVADDRAGNFYMLGSMGLLSSFGLGLAMLNPKQRVFMLEGDGSALMNLGALPLIAKEGPENLVHVILDNEAYESTGAQPRRRYRRLEWRSVGVRQWSRPAPDSGQVRHRSSRGHSKSVALPDRHQGQVQELCPGEGLMKMIILSPGPANITERVRNALTSPDIGHREPEFTDLLQETRSSLLDICGVPEGYACAVLGGSGTTGIEAAITSLRDVTSGVLILSNGVYGERAAQIAELFGIPHTLIKLDWTRPIPLDQAEELISNTPHDVVYFIHHETTTGVLTPLQQVAEIAKGHQKWVLVDAVSSIGGEDLDLAGWGVDLVIGSANKCIRGVPGAAFVILSDQLRDVLSGRRQISFVTDLISALNREEGGETPFTPPVQTMYALREACRELLEEGVSDRISSYREIARALRDGLSNLGLDFLTPREHLSNTMTTVMMPEGASYAGLHSSLKEVGYVIYKSQGHLSETTFRLGTIGVLTQDDIRGFLDSLKKAL